MPMHEALYLALAIVVFVSFMGTLAYASHSEEKSRKD